MTDTHSHIYMPDAFEDGGVAAVDHAIAARVTRLVLPCVDLSSLEPMMELRRRYPDNIRLALGLHPTELSPEWQSDLDKMESLLPGDFAAVGEIGIDLYHDSSMRREQRIAFKRQLEWAQKHSLPVIIHCREGLEDTLDVIGSLESPLPSLIFHSFTLGTEAVKEIRRVCDPWFGINGVVTFKNAKELREALPAIGLERILLETDSPWLAPVPKRGRRNESANIPYIRDCVAATLRDAGVRASSGMPIDELEVERITDNSAAQLFGF